MRNLNRSISLFPYLLLLLFIFITVTTKAEVITLTPDTFSDKVKEKDTAWFVKFCVPWCKHCKNLGSLWEDLGKAMEGEDEIEVGEVDCGTSKPVCSKVDIHSYPTFKLFYDGEEVAKYQGLSLENESKELLAGWNLKDGELFCEKYASGSRDVESLKAFVLDEAEKAAAKAQLDNDKDL